MSPFSSVKCPRCRQVQVFGFRKNLLRLRRRLLGGALLCGGLALGILFLLHARGLPDGKMHAHLVSAAYAQSALGFVVALIGGTLLFRKLSDWRCPSCGSENSRPAPEGAANGQSGAPPPCLETGSALSSDGVGFV